MKERVALAVLAFLLSGSAASAQTPPVGTILTLGGTPQTLYGVDPASGQRSALSEFSDATQGPTFAARQVAGGAGGMVVGIGSSTAAGAQDDGLLVRIDPATGARTVISDFRNTAEGPVGLSLYGVAVESSTVFLVTDRGQGGSGNGAALWRVNAGMRTKLADFNGSSPEGVARDPRNGDIYVADAEGGSQCNLPDATDHCGALVRVDPTTGAKTTVSDFGNAMQGPTGEDPIDLAFDPATSTFLVVDNFAGACGCGEVFHVDPASGQRTLLSDFGNAAQGPHSSGPDAIGVEGDGTIITDGCPGASGNGAFCEIDPSTGTRTNFGDFGDSGLGPVTFGPVAALTFMPVVPALRPTTTAMSCHPVPVREKQRTTCAATVTDTGSGSPTAPTGTITFSSSVAESFPYGFLIPTCTLQAGVTPGTSSCSRAYKPENFGALTLKATYTGDGVHDGSSGSEAVQATQVPRTTITSGPSGKTPSAPHFTYNSDVPGSTFECAFDNQALHACDPAGVVNLFLPNGVHTFRVYAIAPDGTRDPTGDSRRFDIEPATRVATCSLDANIAVVPPALVGTAECDLFGTCPAYSRCQITRTSVTTANMGRGVGWVDLSSCRPPVPAPDVRKDCPVISPPQRITSILCYFPSTGFGAVCPVTVDENLIGQTPVTSYWAPCVLYQEFDMPGSGRVTCTVTLQIAPATSFVVGGGVGGGAGVFLPGAGALAIAPGALPVAAAAKRRPPPFATFRRKVKRAGWVSFRLKLSGPTKSALRRRHRLTLPLRLTFTPKKDKRVVRRERLTLVLPTCRAITPPKPRRTHRPRHPVPPRPHRCAVKL